MNNHAGPADQSESLQQPSSPQLCQNNCGFFANSTTSGLCSKCFRDKEAMNNIEYKQQVDDSCKDNILKQENLQQKSFKQLLDSDKSSLNQPASPSEGSQAEVQRNILDKQGQTEPGKVEDPLQLLVDSEIQQKQFDLQSDIQLLYNSSKEKVPKAKPNRCQVCNKKIGITGFQCKCDKMFCASHRLAEAHSCTFDYKGFQRQKLAENNPLVIGSKVEKL